jgi:serine O-acetyltransferase
MTVFSLIARDLQAKAQWLYGDTTWRSLLKARFTDGTFSMIVYRWMQWAQRHRLTPVAMLFNKLNAVCGHCIIGRGADFGEGFVLVHSLGVVINTSVRGGKRVVIEHQVTIGAEKGQSPQLGDDVFVGAGARILGPVHIGNRTRIGANAVVLTDVPDGATAVGVPARVIPRGEV